MIEHKFFAPVAAATRRSLRRRRAHAMATSTTRRAVSAMAVATMLAGGVAVAQSAGEPPKTAKAIDISRTVASAAARGKAIEVAASSDGAAAAAPAAPPAPSSGPAYRVVAADGGVFTHGWYGYSGSAAGLTSSPITGVAQTVDGEGYWLSAADGGVFSFGAAPFHGSAVGMSDAPVADIAATPSGNGYWLVSSRGGVFTFGDAAYAGGLVDTQLARPVTALAATPSGNGYWLVTADGGVFTFGDAAYFGSTAEQKLNAMVMDLVPTPSGNGYYLVATDGGVFAFGDAPYLGSAGGQKLNKPIVDMSVTPDGNGYWLVAQDGGVFTFGNAPYLGTPGAVSAPVIGIVAGEGKQRPPDPEPVVVAAAVAPAAAAEDAAPQAEGEPAAAAPPAKKGKAKKDDKDKKKDANEDHLVLPGARGLADGKLGWDISYPQCDGSRPTGDYAYAVIGVNGGRAFKHNPCLADQWKWASTTAAAGVYVNVNFPRTSLELAMGASSVRQPECNGAIGCIAYNFGWNGIGDSMAYARSQGVDAKFVWLDVEQLNYWTPDRGLNSVVLLGAIDAVRDLGLGVGVYSTPYQYNKITGGQVTGVPVWTAGASGFGDVQRYCNEKGFGGGPVAFVQLLPGQFDPNVACPGAGPLSTYFKLPKR